MRIRPGSHSVAITGACVFSLAAVALTRVLGYVTDDVIIPALDNDALSHKTLWVSLALIIGVGLVRGGGAFLRLSLIHI
mgnify:CR=1 FL=1